MIDKLVFTWHEIWLWCSEWLTGWHHQKVWIACCRGYFAAKWLTHFRNCPIDGANQREICFDKHFLFTCWFCIWRRERGKPSEVLIIYLVDVRIMMASWTQGWMVGRWEVAVLVQIRPSCADWRCKRSPSRLHFAWAKWAACTEIIPVLHSNHFFSLCDFFSMDRYYFATSAPSDDSVTWATVTGSRMCTWPRLFQWDPTLGFMYVRILENKLPSLWGSHINRL